jgi:hypothetical protein
MAAGRQHQPERSITVGDGSVRGSERANRDAIDRGAALRGRPVPVTVPVVWADAVPVASRKAIAAVRRWFMSAPV